MIENIGNPQLRDEAKPSGKAPIRRLNRREWLAGVAATVLLTGCQSGRMTQRQALERFVFHKGAMGTVFTITVYAVDEATAQPAAAAAFARVVELNDLMTDYDRDSELMRFCLAPYGKPVELSQDLFAVIARAQWLAEQTDGAFDITLGPLIRLWRRARRQRELPPPEYVAAAKLSSGYKNLVLNGKKRTATLLKKDMVLDLGGIAKGYSAAAALQVLKAHGCPQAMVAASGDLAIGDPPPDRTGWNIGIDSIDAAAGEHTRIVRVKNCGLSTSGDTEQYVEIEGRRYSHIVDPQTGLGLRERIGATIVARNATDSDSFGTAVSVMGAERGLKFIEEKTDTAALIVRQQNGVMQQLESKRFRRIKQLG
jgi:FAD:protein FMN transferase